MAAPAQVTTPVPSTGATGVSPTLAQVSWAAAAGATSYNVYFGLSGSLVLVSAAQAGLTYAMSGHLTHGAGYQWRIDSKNTDGVTTGIVWSFTVVTLVAPTPDAENTILPLKHVVVAANDQVWYEAV